MRVSYYKIINKLCNYQTLYISHIEGHISNLTNKEKSFLLKNTAKKGFNKALKSFENPEDVSYEEIRQHLKKHFFNTNKDKIDRMLLC